jgi:hypothetical protein
LTKELPLQVCGRIFHPSRHSSYPQPSGFPQDTHRPQKLRQWGYRAAALQRYSVTALQCCLLPPPALQRYSATALQHYTLGVGVPGRVVASWLPCLDSTMCSVVAL